MDHDPESLLIAVEEAHNIYDFAGHTASRGSLQAQAVHKCPESQRRKLGLWWKICRDQRHFITFLHVVSGA